MCRCFPAESYQQTAGAESARLRPVGLCWDSAFPVSFGLPAQCVVDASRWSKGAVPARESLLLEQFGDFTRN